MENKKTNPVISVTEFKTDATNGMNKHELAAKYGISKESVKEIAKTLGVTLKRATSPKYTLVHDVDDSTFDNLFNFQTETTNLNN